MSADIRKFKNFNILEIIETRVPLLLTVTFLNSRYQFTQLAVHENVHMTEPSETSSGGRNTIKRSSKGKWTVEEVFFHDLPIQRSSQRIRKDEKLRQAVLLHKGKNWKKIAEHLEGREDTQCLHRWQKVLNPSLVKGPWTKEV